MTTLAARIAPWLPARLTAATARALYPRFEPELTRLADMLPAAGPAARRSTSAAGTARGPTASRARPAA